MARVEHQLYNYPSTEGSMIRHGGCLYVSNLGEGPLDRRINDPCETPPKPSPCGSRHNLTLHASCDEAKTWRMLGAVWDGPAAYSSVATLPWRADAVGVLYESSRPLHHTANGGSYVGMSPYQQLSYSEVPVAGGPTATRERMAIMAGVEAAGL